MRLTVHNLGTMDKYQEMRVFTAVVDAGSFVAAGEALGMSKAAVSRYVSELELRLGVRLVSDHRNGSTRDRKYGSTSDRNYGSRS